MYCSHLSILNDLLNDNEIQKLDNYFSSLIGGARENITVSKVSNAIGITTQTASKVLTKCLNIHILAVSYSIRCPSCGMLIKKTDNIADVLSETLLCYNCDETFKMQPENTEVVYSIVYDDDDESVFIIGQQRKNETSAKSVVPIEDTLYQVLQAGGLNNYLFHPSDSEYARLEELLNRVLNCNGETKQKGDTLEFFTEELFNLCPVFNASAIRTQLNQIDCCVRNKAPLGSGVLQIVGSLFYIECKNERKTPSGSYISKLHSIIQEANGGADAKCIKFGVIISKLIGPSTFKKHAVKYYLSNKIVIISICCDELKGLIKRKENLLELIERKANEIMLDSTTDLKEAGLFES